MDPITAWISGDKLFPLLPGTAQEQAVGLAAAAASLVLSPLSLSPGNPLSTVIGMGTGYVPS